MKKNFYSYSFNENTHKWEVIKNGQVTDEFLTKEGAMGYINQLQNEEDGDTGLGLTIDDLLTFD